MVKCTNCSIDVPDNQFCPECGAFCPAVAEEAEPTPHGGEGVLQVGHALRSRYLVEEVLQVSRVNLYCAIMDQRPVLVKERILPILGVKEKKSILEESGQELSTEGEEFSFLAFKSEFELLSTMTSRALQKAYDHFPEERREYLILEWPTGKKLADLVSEKEIVDEDFALEVAIQLCQAVSLVHQHGYAHLDVEPCNVFLEGDTVKLFNFGRIAQLVAAIENI